MRLLTNLNYKLAAGFSYLELLIVISVFALLIILLVPPLIQTKNSAQKEEIDQQIIHQLQIIKLSLEKFNFNHGYYPVYNFPLPQQNNNKYATLKDITKHYPKLAKLLQNKIKEAEKYYYYAPANTNLVNSSPFYPSQEVLTQQPLKGANRFILIYNGNHKYYKLTSYSSSLTIKEKKDTNKKQQEQLKDLVKF
ncbi:hypothetical protein [Halanaerobacter jeridensis]|uniref:Type II secretory pathway pseudopilin PulG n=1 Tax=Halanaerobacter jeridensis TaxID=706427 RepID=A0A938XUK0_9FIRM|nr:hypothetical protein [Halanaerobacter jeridensis]MBM7555842.1 type II secretory pathway pseudopilin PulG [Halanaerobacter jeridensis]